MQNKDMKYENKIVEMADVAIDSVVFNPQNWRIHPKEQQALLDEQMQRVGWLQPVIINKRTGNLIDGHLRVILAERGGLPTIPATIVDLSEEDERIALASFDTVTVMAGTDDAKLEELLGIIAAESEQVEGLIEAITKEHKLFREEDDGETLMLHNATLAEPIHKVALGETYRLGEHYLVIASPMRDVHLWKNYLKKGMYFVPYPNPVTYLAENTPIIVGATTDTYLAGHILDRYAEVYGEDSIVSD